MKREKSRAEIVTQFSLDSVSMLLLFSLHFQTCEDFILECRFAGRVFPCFQKDPYLTWTTTTSHHGACCSFNYHPISNDFTPFAANTFGSEGGLTVIGTGYPATVDTESGTMFSSGFVVSSTVEFKEYDISM